MFDRVSPAGKWPEARLHLIGSSPPVDDSSALYVLPVQPTGRDDVVITSGWTMTIEKVATPLLAFADESVTSKATLNVPAVVGVPETDPLTETLSPAGREPGAIFHL